MTKINSKKGFSESLKRLEEIVLKLEDPNLDLEVCLELLEEGVSIHNYCKTALTEANKKISTILKETDDNDKS